MPGWCRFPAVLTALTLLTAILPGPGSAAAACRFVLGFAAFADQLPQVVGQCVDDEQHDPVSGDALQRTTTGLLVWRRADNVTAFTNGFHTWVAGPDGIEERQNSQRFAWEANPTHLPLAPETVLANRLAWSGAQVSVQAGAALTLAAPAPDPADLGRLPAVSADGLPAPGAALLPDGNVAFTVAIPADAAGGYLLTARWPDGQQAQLRLAVGATVTLADGLGNPDDLTVAPDGSVLYTDLASNTVGQILADGTRRTLISGLNVPEGLAVTGPSTLLLADQGTDRVLAWTPSGGLHSLLQLSPVPGQAGIDGLSAAMINGHLTALLPDSPNGQLLLLPLDTLTPTLVAGHWSRPTDAIVRAGQLYLTDEYGGRLWRGPVQGPLAPVGPTMTLPDEVAVDPSGVAFVAALGQGATGGRIEQIAADGQASAALTGLNDPQGLDLDGAGNLILAEGGSGRIAADIRTCRPVLLGGASVTLRIGSPAQALSLGADCLAGQPSFTLAPGAQWPAAAGVTWPGAGAATTTLSNGVSAALEANGGAALLVLQPPVQGMGGEATLSVQLQIGSRMIPQQVRVTVTP